MSYTKRKGTQQLSFSSQCEDTARRGPFASQTPNLLSPGTECSGTLLSDLQPPELRNECVGLSPPLCGILLRQPELRHSLSGPPGRETTPALGQGAASGPWSGALPAGSWGPAEGVSDSVSHGGPGEEKDRGTQGSGTTGFPLSALTKARATLGGHDDAKQPSGVREGPGSSPGRTYDLVVVLPKGPTFHPAWAWKIREILLRIPAPTVLGSWPPNDWARV